MLIKLPNVFNELKFLSDSDFYFVKNINYMDAVNLKGYGSLIYQMK